MVEIIAVRMVTVKMERVTVILTATVLLTTYVVETTVSLTGKGTGVHLIPRMTAVWIQVTIIQAHLIIHVAAVTPHTSFFAYNW